MWKNLWRSNPPCTLNDGQCHTMSLTSLYAIRRQCQTMSLTLCTFVIHKVNRIPASIKTTIKSLNNERFQSKYFNGQPMDSFRDVVPSGVLKIINKLPNKSSPRDVLPTSLLKLCADVLPPVIANLANISFRTRKTFNLEQGNFHLHIKRLRCFVKKPGLDQVVSINYRPFSTSTPCPNQWKIGAGPFEAAPTRYWELQSATVCSGQSGTLPPLNWNGTSENTEQLLQGNRWKKTHSHNKSWHIGCIWYNQS